MADSASLAGFLIHCARADRQVHISLSDGGNRFHLIAHPAADEYDSASATIVIEVTECPACGGRHEIRETDW